jgi:hypothetical protein
VPGERRNRIWREIADACAPFNRSEFAYAPVASADGQCRNGPGGSAKPFRGGTRVPIEVWLVALILVSAVAAAVFALMGTGHLP